MKIHTLLILLFISLVPASGAAYLHHESCEQQPTKTAVSKEEKEKWLKEVREKKHQFLAKELNLTKEQQKTFFECYDAMEDETRKLHKETRQLERRTRELGENASDLEYQKATEALYEEKTKEAAIEAKYKEKFQNILTPHQLFKLKGAERQFTRRLMEQHRKLKN